MRLARTSDRARFAAIVFATLLGPALGASAQPQNHYPDSGQHATQGCEGRHGVGQAKWHEQFYSKLVRKDTKTSCCNLADCVPTQSRMNGEGYEVLVDGEWTNVPPNAIQNVTAPDGGAHVCF